MLRFCRKPSVNVQEITRLNGILPDWLTHFTHGVYCHSGFDTILEMLIIKRRFVMAARTQYSSCSSYEGVKGNQTGCIGKI